MMNMLGGLVAVALLGAVTVTSDGQRCLVTADHRERAQRVIEAFAEGVLTREQFLQEMEALAPLWCFDKEVIRNAQD